MGPLPKELRATEVGAYLVSEDERILATCGDPDGEATQDDEALAYELARRYNEEPRLRAALEEVLATVKRKQPDRLTGVEMKIVAVAYTALRGEDS